MLRYLFLKIHLLNYKVLSVKAYYYSLIVKECGLNLKLWGTINIKNPQNLIIGNNVSINDNVYINAAEEIILEDNVTLSAHSKIITTSLDPEVYPERKHFHKPIVLKKNAWIGAGAIILPGVTVFDNAIVAAGSVVTKNVNPNEIVAGIPAKKLRSLTND